MSEEQSVLTWADVENLGYTPDTVMQFVNEHTALLTQVKNLGAITTSYRQLKRELEDSRRFTTAVETVFETLKALLGDRPIPFSAPMLDSWVNLEWGRLETRNVVERQVDCVDALRGAC